MTAASAFIHSHFISDPVYSMYVIKISLSYPINCCGSYSHHIVDHIIRLKRDLMEVYFLTADGPLPIFSLFGCQLLIYFIIIIYLFQ